jgi:hypothetical protein
MCVMVHFRDFRMSIVLGVDGWAVIRVLRVGFVITKFVLHNRSLSGFGCVLLAFDWCGVLGMMLVAFLCRLTSLLETYQESCYS